MSNRRNKRQWGVYLTVAGAVATAIFGAAGCGSGSGNSVTQPGIVATGIANTITRATENTLSDDAKILATRQATGAFVSLADAQAFDADLTKIRAAYPAVVGVHARLSYEPKSLLVIVKSTAPWIAKWDTSVNTPSAITDTDLTTGEATLDATLKKYDATRTTYTSTSNATNGRYYVLRFAESLNMQVVAAEFAQSSPNIVTADVNTLIGDGDNIVYTAASSTNGAKTYAFSQGYGDCPGGCISHYTHTYTIAPDGSISETITGTPPGTGQSATIAR